MTKEEPKLLLIDEGDLYVAIWVQSGMVGQGTDVEDALRDLLLSIKARVARDLETLRAGDPDERLVALYNAGETYEVPDEPVRTLFLAIEKEVGKVFEQPSRASAPPAFHAMVRRAHGVVHHASAG